MTNDLSGGLRGLRPPATFCATLRVAEVSQLYSYPRKSLALNLTLTAAPQLQNHRAIVDLRRHPAGVHGRYAVSSKDRRRKQHLKTLIAKFDTHFGDSAGLDYENRDCRVGRRQNIGEASK